MTLEPGKTIGKWTLIEFHKGNDKATPRTHARWLCQCECGTKREVRQAYLTSARSKSCGCTVAAEKSRTIGWALTPGFGR